MKLSHSISYYSLIVLKKFLSTLSARTRYKISNQLASLLYNYINIRKNQAKTNLKKAFPYWSDRKIHFTLKKMYQFFSFNFIQFISVPKSWEKLEIEVIGRDILDSNLEKGRGVIFITGHFGAWEILGKWLGEYTELFAGIALRQKNKGANQFFQEQRELPGTKQFYKRENSIEIAYEILSSNGVLGLVSDQDARKKGVFVNFFGSSASTPKGAALFHLNTAAPIMMGACTQKGFQKYEIRFFQVDASIQSVERITQSYTSLLEKCIRKNPEQYFWFHKRWKTAP
tara:strand:+ start:1606 stop:2460 length:855 start_codon:yes stop_codon:yes gene_type:complete